MKVECLSFRPIKHDTLKGIAKIKLSDLGMIINDVKLFKKAERTWVSMPTSSYEKEGNKVYYPLVQMEDKNVEKELMNSILTVVLQRINDVKEDYKDSVAKSGWDQDIRF